MVILARIIMSVINRKDLHVKFSFNDNSKEMYEIIMSIKDSKPLKPEIKIDDVQIACQIGSGKFSDVFLAIVGPDCYALKVLKPYYSHRATEERDTLLLLTKYCVPHIPRLISVFNFSEPQRTAFLMDLMYEHYDLESIRQLSIDIKLEIIYKILLTLKTANKAGIIHGNICPSNVLIDSSLDQFNFQINDIKTNDLKKYVNVLIVGWNISIRSQESSTLQRIFYNKSISIQYTISSKDRKIYGGNNLFKAPELLVCKNSITNKVDTWSVGCLFAYYLLDDEKFLWGEKDKEKKSNLPDNLYVLHQIAEKMGPSEVLETCKEKIPAEYIGTFSSANKKEKDIFDDVLHTIYKPINCLIKNITNDIINDSKIENKEYFLQSVNYEFIRFNEQCEVFIYNVAFWKKLFNISDEQNQQNQQNQLINDLHLLEQNIVSFDECQENIKKNLIDFLTRCICVSEYMRYNIGSALEQVTAIRTSFQNIDTLLKKMFALYEKNKC